jgi:hypothetical protein
MDEEKGQSFIRLGCDSFWLMKERLMKWEDRRAMPDEEIFFA